VAVAFGSLGHAAQAHSSGLGRSQGFVGNIVNWTDVVGYDTDVVAYDSEPRSKTLRQELQDEIDDWLKDVY